MSGLAGVLWYGGRPAASDDAARLLAQLSHRRGRPVAVTTSGVSMGFLDESGCCDGHSQDGRDARDPIVMIDGHIHNRDELARELQLAKGASDTNVVRAAWRRWRRECPLRFIGDFALTIYDEGRLFAARDCAPFRSFYYRPMADACHWASELAPLVRHARPPINEGVVAEYLADRVTTIEETLFEGVFRLPPAHALEIDRDGELRVWRYWTPDPRAEIRYRRQEEYNEHFRALFRAAVRATLPAEGPVALWYSGGVDSSAIASEMAALRDEGDSSIARPLETFSMSVPGYAEDETPYFTAGAAHFGFRNTVLPLYFGTAEEFEHDARTTLDIPEVPNSISAKHVWQALADRDFRVSLTGLGGDDWFIGSQFAVFDDVRTLRFIRAWQRIRTTHALDLGFSAKQLLKLGVWLHLPDVARRQIRGAMRWKITPRHIASSFARRTNLDDRLRQGRLQLAWPTFAQADVFASSTAPNSVILREMQARVAARWRVETRQPFEDRRLVEFALALPPEQLLAPGVPRHIVLSALEHRIPRSVFSRVDGVNFSCIVSEALGRVGGHERLAEVLRDLPEWFDAEEMQAMVRRIESATGGERARMGREIWVIWQAFAIHLWWKAVHEPAARATLI